MPYATWQGTEKMFLAFWGENPFLPLEMSGIRECFKRGISILKQSAKKKRNRNAEGAGGEGGRAGEEGTVH